MENKKRVTILVTIALILAITAVTLNVTNSSQEVQTVYEQPSPTGAVIGIEILQGDVEDKLNQEPEA